MDIVADAGKVWIRVNTYVLSTHHLLQSFLQACRVKNSRLLAEFREIDSYLTESEEDSDWDSAERPTLAQPEFDNSILKMGRALLQAARANPVVEGTMQIPRVIMRLTRLDPTIVDGLEADPRIAKTVQLLEEMGVEVQLGERTEELVAPSSSAAVDDVQVVPSRRINLDLSVLIALISEMTHAPLPKSVEEANKRFIPPKEYLDWKETRRKERKDGYVPKDLDEGLSIEDLPRYLATHSRALTHQLLGEMGKSMIQEIRDRIDQAWPGTTQDVEFWVTTEARDRCLRIVSKIGAVNEKRRAYTLFCIDPSDPSRRLSLEEAEELFWQNSRFNRTLPLFPLHFHSASLPPDNSIFSERANRHVFFKELAGTCQHILDQEAMPHPNARPSLQFQFISQRTPFPSHPSQHYDTNGHMLHTSEPPTAVSDPPSIDFAATADEEIQRAAVTKANPRLTAHTVESMLWGAELGWTTLTANRTSVRAIMKEIRMTKVLGKLEGLNQGSRDKNEGEKDERRGTAAQVAALWIVDPRSLAEQMCGQSLYDSSG